MKKLLVPFAIASTCLLTQAFAQTKNFEGFSASVAGNAFNAKTDVSGVTDMSAENSGTVSVKGGYGFALGQQFVLGLGLEYDLGKFKAGASAASNVNFIAKALTTLSVEPGYSLAPNTLIYAKVAYQTVNLTIEGSGAPAGGAPTNFDGVAYGLGVRSVLGRNMFVGLEVQQSTFGAKYYVLADIKPSITMASVNLGYKF